MADENKIDVAALLKLLQELQSGNRETNLQFGPFNENEETFTIYKQRLENYLHMRSVTTDERKVQILINCIGTKHYQLLSSLTAPDMPNTKTYEELIVMLEDHLWPKPNEITEQHKFLLRTQHEGESVATYVAELKRLSVFCNFTCTSCKKSTAETHLRSQFIRGISDAEIRQRLLEEIQPNMKKILETALAMEASKIQSRSMQEVHQVKDSAEMYQNEKWMKRKENTSKIFNGGGAGKNDSNNRDLTCYRCGKPGHKASECRTKNKLYCYQCKATGHIANVCMKKNKKDANTHSANAIETIDKDELKERNTLRLYTESDERSKFLIRVSIEDKPFEMEFDTGSAISTISEKLLHSRLPEVKINPTNTKLKAYNGSIFPALGVARVSVTHDNKSIRGNLYIVDDKFDTIFGREWIKALQLLPPKDVKTITPVNGDVNKLEKHIFESNEDLFNNTIGTIPDIKGKLKLREGVSPIYIKPRPVPYAIRHLIEDEIERLKKCGTLEKVEHSDWGTPVVPIIKAENQIRLCADYKVTLNKVIMDDKYPIPKIEDIMHKLANGKYYCVFDVHKAYLHMTMNEESALMQTISTHKGLYKVRKLMFGVKTAPNIWQRFMDENITNNLSGTQCFFDDIIVAGRTFPETMERVQALLDKLRRYNIHLNKSKCKLFREAITYLGYTISEAGIQKNKDKTKAIAEITRPRDVSELRQFIGMVTYYNNFIPNMATILNPLYKLLRNDVKFIWNEECQRAFTDIKAELQSDSVLMPYEEKLPLILATDASPVGISAILSHKTPTGERPIAYASRALSKSESNYSQLHKEATAIYWALLKFFNYCYGREFTLITDNKPLAMILNPDKILPALTSQRLLSYAQFLSGFKYKIEHREAKNHMNVDFLSRHPVAEIDQPEDKEELTVYQLAEDVLPITSGTISKAMKSDNVLCDLYNRLQTGSSLERTPFKGQEAELTLQNGCIFKGIRILIPSTLQKQILKELHMAHIGIVKMKALARSYCYWSGIDYDIETMVKSCRECARVAKEPSKAPVHTWELPTMPWQRIHMDFAGPFMEHYFLVVVDARTRWLEVVPMKTITSFYTIRSVRELFARFGLPQIVVTDNGTNFTSKEFQDFLQSNGIKHKRTAPAHPSTNGQAERSVQTLKCALRAAMNDPGDLHVKLQRFLLQYRKVINSTTGRSPAEQMLRFNLRSTIDLIKPTDRINDYTNINPLRGYRRELCIGDTVQIRWYQNKAIKWKFGKVIQKEGLLHYVIEVEGKLQRRHIDQIRATLVEGNREGYSDSVKRYPNTEVCPSKNDDDGNITRTENIESTDEVIDPQSTEPQQIGGTSSTAISGQPGESIIKRDGTEITAGHIRMDGPEGSTVRRSGRVRRAPNRMNL